MSDRSRAPIPPNLHPSSLFSSPAIHKYVAKVDAQNAALFQNPQQKPMSRAETRRNYLDGWSLDGKAQDNAKAVTTGSAENSKL
ncbi:hypothetical protein XANCAGTX0491_008639 [Xanthoria calcicola]